MHSPIVTSKFGANIVNQLSSGSVLSGVCISDLSTMTTLATMRNKKEEVNRKISQGKRNEDQFSTSSKSNSAANSPRLGRSNKRSMTSFRESDMTQKVKTVVPKLNHGMHKGQCGRVAVFGGCILYTGAPYFAAISALKVGADLVHVFCEKEAGTVIKTYSPELIVHPVLDTEYGMEEIDSWLPRLHSVVLGPGLGRNQSMLGRISLILEKVKAFDLPIVIDADGLWHLTINPDIIKGYQKAVITPNAMEFSRLVKSVLCKDVAPSVQPDPQVVADLATAMGNITVVHKGTQDIISNGRYIEVCDAIGAPRRCGGQGDLLAGALATFLHWSMVHGTEGLPPPGATVTAAWGACRLARACALQSYNQNGRSSTTTDLINQIHSEFARLFENETYL